MIFKFYLNNKPIQPPINWKGIKIPLNYKDASATPSINTDELEFVLDENDEIRNWGLNKFEPPELRIEVGNGQSSIEVFKGLVDLTNNPLYIDSNRIKVRIKPQDVDVLGSKAESLTFRYLDSLGYFSESDYVKIPYVLSFIPDYAETATISIGIFAVRKEIKEQIERIESIFAEFAGIAASGLSGPIGALILSGLKLLINIAYFAALTIALKTLITDLLSSLISPIRYYKGIRLRKLLESGITELGYNFSSTELGFWDNFVLLPEKDGRSDKLLDEKGYPDRNSSLYNFKDLLDFYKTLINGAYQINDNVIRCENILYYEKTASYFLDENSILLEEYSINTDEAVSNFALEFSKDQLDKNTLVDYAANKTAMQRITKITNLVNKKNSLLRGAEQVVIPASLPTRKAQLTEIEIALKVLASLADSLLKLFDAITGKNSANLAQKIKDRVGMLNLSEDMVGLPKLIYFPNNEIPDNYRDVMNSEVLYNKYYYMNTYSVEKKNYNQYRTYKQDIPLKFEDVKKLVINSYFNTSSSLGRFDTIELEPENNIASCEFRIKKIVEKNLKDVIV